MLKRISKARGYVLSATIVALTWFCFNNCSQSALPPGLDQSSTGVQSPQPNPGVTDPSTLSIFPASTQAEPYSSQTFTISGGTPPYTVSGDFSGTLDQPGTMPFVGFLPRDYNATVSDSTGASMPFKLTVTGTLAPAIAVAYTLAGTNDLNYYYTSELEQSNKFPVTDVANGFPIYALIPPSHTRAIYQCDNGSARQFLSTDENCEGRPKLAKLGYLYDSPNAVPGYPLKALIRIYNSSNGLHRVQTSDATLPSGFAADGLTLGYLAPKVPTEWCNHWVKCP